jgi:putative endonuclease
MHKKTALGRQGEDLVGKFLERQGFTIIARNYAKRDGEIDLIASKGDTLAFVEVKTRSKIYFDVSEVITPSKQRKIIMVAKEFIVRHGHDTKIGRFDVAFIETCADNAITYIENAFCE